MDQIVLDVWNKKNIYSETNGKFKIRFCTNDLWMSYNKFDHSVQFQILMWLPYDQWVVLLLKFPYFGLILHPIEVFIEYEN